jgi:regulator of sirC expression with transglutaminase-like and TPR domain
MKGTPGEITALLNLIEDPDEEVYQTVKCKLVELGEIMLPILEHFGDVQDDPLQQARISELVSSILLNLLGDSLQEWQNADDQSILEASVILHQFLDRDANRDQFFFEIEKIRKSIWLELNDYLTPLEEVNIFNKVIFAHFKYTGTDLNYNKTQEFDLGNLLKVKSGNTFAFGALYVILGEMLGIPIEPVSLPRQNLLAYLDSNDNQALRKEEDILFFLDPLSGQVYSHKDIQDYMEKLDNPAVLSKLDQSNRFDYVIRWLAELAKSEKKCGADDKHAGINAIIRQLNN